MWPSVRTPFRATFCFPLVIFPCRASLYSLLYRKGHSESSSYIPEQRFRFITIFIVVFSLCVALVIPSVELIIGLVGSTIGVAICIMFPASSFRKIIKKESMERTLAQFVFVSGFLLMILGTYANLSAIDEKSSGPEFDIVPIVTPLYPDGQVPAIVGELPKHLAKDPIENEKNVLLKKLEVQKPDLIKETVEEKILDKPKVVETAASDNPPLPPLPIDEVHVVPLESNKAASDLKKQPAEAQYQPEAKPADVNLAVDKPKENPPAIVAALSDTPKIESSMLSASNTIDGAAIKKEEDVAAEEQKESKANADELIKTQKELKETKKLLAKTVGELNEELAKKNPLSQPLELEKKEPLEAKVAEESKKMESVLKEPQPVAGANEERKRKASLIDILTENTHLRDEKEAHAGVFEPLSYKTGELLKNSSVNTADLIKRLPIPLALMVNATQLKAINDTEIKKPNLEDNVEAIRRELLNLRSSGDVTEPPPARVKREASNEENCLRQPKLDIVNNNAAAVALSLNLQSIGRDLKSIKDDDVEITTENESYQASPNGTQIPLLT
ncbi:putative sodium-coupled neutral amino acid transporter 10 isoform X2 [Drosophila eugracilis]|uniref:putative sodium-coupled neutral amino acid transporter 10 isoform X2 n=1 Tax=Drosophila eugracilis TaxID=29029 RepID=UPI001BDA4AB0|nr:putative sodium-coupled neutral amino acid transporter 10 isoform X2 [Drosophila eugracilis]